MPAETSAIDRLLAAFKEQFERMQKEGRPVTWPELIEVMERMRK